MDKEHNPLIEPEVQRGEAQTHTATDGGERLEPTERTQIKRYPTRGNYERGAIEATAHVEGNKDLRILGRDACAALLSPDTPRNRP